MTGQGTQQAEPRELNVIMGLELTELTPEELELVVAERARVQARDSAYAEQMETIREGLEQIQDVVRASNRRFETTMETLVGLAINRYRNASDINGGDGDGQA